MVKIDLSAAEKDALLTLESLSNYMLNALTQRLGLTLTQEQMDAVLARFEGDAAGLMDAKNKELNQFNFNSVGGV